MANPAVSPSLSTITTVEPPSLFANGVAEATVTVTVKDVNGALVGNGSAGQDAAAKVTVAVSGARNTVTYPQGQNANANGQVTAIVTSTRTGVKVVTATVRHDDGQISTSDRRVAGVDQTVPGVNVGLADVSALNAPQAGGSVGTSQTNEDFTSTVTVTAPDIQFVNCRFTASPSDLYAVICDNQANVSFTDCEFIGGRLGNVQGRGFTALRCWAHGSQADGLVLTVGTERVQWLQGLIEDFGNGPIFPGRGVLAAPGCPVRLGGTRIEAPDKDGSNCIRATSVVGQPVPNQLTCESVWLNGGDPVVMFENGGGGRPTVCQLQNVRFGRRYGDDGLLRSDDTDADEVLEGGSLKRWCIWDDTLETIQLSDVPLAPPTPTPAGRWVNENWNEARDGHFRYPFEVYNVVPDPPVTLTFIGTAPSGHARQGAGWTTAAGGLASD